ncbi:MAG: hypothetical protein ACE5EW_01055 [Thermoplasmata archaeon]
MGRSIGVDLNWSAPKGHEEFKKEAGRGPAGLYLIIAGKRIAGKWNKGTFKLIDVGQASDIHLRVAVHEREDCWHPHARGSFLIVKIAELPGEYDEADRRALVCCLRAAERPPCGSDCNDGYRRDESVEISNRGDAAPLRSQYSS